MTTIAQIQPLPAPTSTGPRDYEQYRDQLLAKLSNPLSPEEEVYPDFWEGTSVREIRQMTNELRRLAAATGEPVAVAEAEEIRTVALTEHHRRAMSIAAHLAERTYTYDSPFLVHSMYQQSRQARRALKAVGAPRQNTRQQLRAMAEPISPGLKLRGRLHPVGEALTVNFGVGGVIGH